MAEWWRDGVVFQIYPRSFADTNGDGLGDLPGITAHLDHLAWLGVDALWLSPFYPSPDADFGYDIADYTGVDPRLGTLADFDALMAEAHRLGLRVVVDLVPNHTSDRHPWFQQSRRATDDPYRDFYIWRDPRPDGGPPNNWLSSFPEVGTAWTQDPATGQYYLHSFTPQQPDLNWWNPAVREAMDGVLRFWLDRGVDGFRIDVAHRLGKDPELLDNPGAVAEARRYQAHPTERQRHLNWPEGHAILRRFRTTLDAYPERMAVGEAVIPDPVELALYYGEAADELNLAFDFAFTFLGWDAAATRAEVDALEAAFQPSGAWPARALANHDVPRVASRLGDAQARVAAVLLLTLRGTPFVYQGDELGLRDVPVPPEQAHDPDGRDPQRAPMPWAPGPGHGFTTGTPWLPFGDDADQVNVAVQREDPASMLTLYRRLLAVRRASPALTSGSYRALAPQPEGVFAYLREAGGERVLVVLAFDGDARSLTLEGLPAGGELLVSTEVSRAPGPVGLAPLGLAGHEGLLVRLPAEGRT